MDPWLSLAGSKTEDEKQPGLRLPSLSFVGHTAIGLSLILLIALFAFGCDKKKQETSAVETPEVVAAEVVQKDVPIVSSSNLGTLKLGVWICQHLDQANSNERSQ